jgi:hypothetical protein
MSASEQDASAPHPYPHRLLELRDKKLNSVGMLAHLAREFKALGGAVAPEPGQDTGQGAQPGNLGTELDDLPVYTLAEIDDGDLVLKALFDMGRVLAGPRNMAAGVGWDIICPWDQDHSDRAHTGTAYFRGGGFKCHHGHCQERGPADVWRRVSELLDDYSGGLDSLEERAFRDWPAGTVLHKPSQASPPGPALALSLARSLAYLVPEDAIMWRKVPNVRVPLPAFDRAWALKLGPNGADVLPLIAQARGERRLKPSEWYIGHPAREDVYGLVWLPGSAEVTPSPDDPRVRLLNTWRGHTRTLKDVPDALVDEAAVKPWLDLVDHVFPAGHGTEADPTGSLRDLILDWLALILAEPSVKPGWHVLLTGGQGIGKDFLPSVIEHLMPRDVAHINSGHLASPYSGWLKARLILGQELRQTTRGQATGHDQYQRLKEVTSDTDPWLAVNGKYERPSLARNVCALWLTSNEAAPLPIENDDRRFVVFRSPALPWPAQRYTDLGAWLKGGSPSGYELVGEYLYRRWEGMDEGRRRAVTSRPPSTEAKAELARSSRPGASIWLEDAILAEPPDPSALPDVVSAETLVDAMARAVRSNQGLSPDTRVPSATQMGIYLREAKCQRLNQGRQVRHKGRVYRLWSLRNHDVYTKMTADQLVVVLDSQTGQV